MSGQAWLILALCMAALVFLVAMTSIPERVIEWRRQFWETDSDGMLGPPYKMNSFEEASMTTDADEGQRQAEAMQPPKLKVGDKVRLMAGIQHMTVVALEDYDRLAVCERQNGPEGMVREAFPVVGLVLV